MAADMATKGDSLVPGTPRAWSGTTIRDPGFFRIFAMSPDDKRAMIFARQTAESQGPVHVMLLENFFDELRRRIPAN